LYTVNLPEGAAKPGVPDEVAQWKSVAGRIGFDHSPQNGCIGIIRDLAGGLFGAANRTTVNQNQDLTRTGLSKTQLEICPELLKRDWLLNFRLF